MTGKRAGGRPDLAAQVLRRVCGCGLLEDRQPGVRRSRQAGRAPASQLRSHDFAERSLQCVSTPFVPNRRTAASPHAGRAGRRRHSRVSPTPWSLCAFFSRARCGIAPRGRVKAGLTMASRLEWNLLCEIFFFLPIHFLIRCMARFWCACVCLRTSVARCIFLGIPFS